MTLRAVSSEEEIKDRFLKQQPEILDSLVSAYPVPSENTFGDADYLPGHDLDMMLSKLINRHETLFSHLVNLRITCVWKARGGKEKGKKRLGHAQSASGLVGHFSEADFIILLSADHLREQHERVIEATLFHQCLHIQYDPDDGKVFIVDHDFSGFTEEVKEYGLWRVDLERAKGAFAQLRLLEKKEKV